MNKLIKIENNSELGPVVSSRIVAEELDRRHSHVIRDLEKILLDPNVGSVIFESKYKDVTGRTLKEYLLTKDGFILYMFNIQGHNDFKMAYINKFNEMEYELKQNNIQLPTDPMEVLKLMFDATNQTNKRVLEVEKDVVDLKENQKLDAGEYSLVGTRINQKVRETIRNYNLANTRYVISVLHKDINGSIKRITNTHTRTQLKQKHFELVLSFINDWAPSSATLYDVRQITAEFN